MAAPRFDVVIAGAGVAALAAARYIRRSAGRSARIALVTPDAPMSATSSLSSECFRDHWPSPQMRSFMARSISLLDEFAGETDDCFRMSRAGYLYVSRHAASADSLLREARGCHSPSAVRSWRGPQPAYYADGDGDVSPNSSGEAAEAALRGADVFLDGEAVRSRFPFLAADSAAALHARNAGWLSAQTMGMAMLDELQSPGGGLQVIRGRVTGAALSPGGDRVHSVTVRGMDGSSTSELVCGAFVNSAGPRIGATHGAMFTGYSGSGGGGGGGSRSLELRPLLGVAGPGALHGVPVYSEVHAKVVFRDVLGIIPRDAPMTISNDALSLAWTQEERSFLEEAYSPEVVRRLTAELPPGAHFRPYGGEGSDAVLMLWECWHHGIHPSEPPPEAVTAFLDHELYPEVALRGLSLMVPDLAAYFNDDIRDAVLTRRRKRAGRGRAGEAAAAPSDDAPGRKPYVDGGYYTKVEENLPLVGPAPGFGGRGAMSNAFLCGALSGYGIMASHAAGELCAAHVIGASALPAYAGLMSPLRYQEEEYMRPGGTRDALLAAGGGQL